MRCVLNNNSKFKELGIEILDSNGNYRSTESILKDAMESLRRKREGYNQNDL